MDETEFKINFGKAPWVIIIDASKALVMADADYSKYITSAEMTNGVEYTILAFLILQSQHIL